MSFVGVKVCWNIPVYCEQQTILVWILLFQTCTCVRCAHFVCVHVHVHVHVSGARARVCVCVSCVQSKKGKMMDVCDDLIVAVAVVFFAFVRKS